jgi:hypothetical protein
MDRYFIARQQHSKVKLAIPELYEIDKYSEQTKESQPLMKKADLCAKIAKSRGIKIKDIPEFISRHRLMGHSVEELSAMYPDMWKLKI